MFKQKLPKVKVVDGHPPIGFKYCAHFDHKDEKFEYAILAGGDTLSALFYDLHIELKQRGL